MTPTLLLLQLLKSATPFHTNCTAIARIRNPKIRLIAPTAPAEALDEWASQDQQQIDGEAERDDSDYHAEVRKKMIGGCGKSHDDADRAWPGQHRHGHGRKRNVLFGQGLAAFRQKFRTNRPKNIKTIRIAIT